MSVGSSNRLVSSLSDEPSNRNNMNSVIHIQVTQIQVNNCTYSTSFTSSKYFINTQISQFKSFLLLTMVYEITLTQNLGDNLTKIVDADLCQIGDNVLYYRSNSMKVMDLHNIEEGPRIVDNFCGRSVGHSVCDDVLFFMNDMFYTQGAPHIIAINDQGKKFKLEIPDPRYACKLFPVFRDVSEGDHLFLVLYDKKDEPIIDTLIIFNQECEVIKKFQYVDAWQARLTMFKLNGELYLHSLTKNEMCLVDTDSGKKIQLAKVVRIYGEIASLDVTHLVQGKDNYLTYSTETTSYLVPMISDIINQEGLLDVEPSFMYTKREGLRVVRVTEKALYFRNKVGNGKREFSISGTEFYEHKFPEKTKSARFIQ